MQIRLRIYFVWRITRLWRSRKEIPVPEGGEGVVQLDLGRIRTAGFTCNREPPFTGIPLRLSHVSEITTIANWTNKPSLRRPTFVPLPSTLSRWRLRLARHTLSRIPGREHWNKFLVGTQLLCRTRTHPMTMVKFLYKYTRTSPRTSTVSCLSFDRNVVLRSRRVLRVNEI